MYMYKTKLSNNTGQRTSQRSLAQCNTLPIIDAVLGGYDESMTTGYWRHVTSTMQQQRLNTGIILTTLCEMERTILMHPFNTITIPSKQAN